MSMNKIWPLKFNDGRTKQAFKDSTDINKILKKHQVTNVQSHLVQFPAEAYAEFEDVDLLKAYAQIDRAGEIFGQLPSEVRSEFDNNALRFVRYAADPANNKRLAELFPAIAAPGAYFVNPVSRGGQGAGAATAPTEAPVPQAGAGGGVPTPAPAAGSGEGVSPPVQD